MKKWSDLKALNPFGPDGLPRTEFRRRLDAVNPFDRETGLPKKQPFNDALDRVNPYDRTTGLPKEQ
jgi:hypothetical protein